MLTVRVAKNASGNTAVQVVYRHNHKTTIIKHIGTARSVGEEKQLRILANQYIANNVDFPPLLPEAFSEKEQGMHIVAIEHLRFTKGYHHFAHEFLSHIYQWMGFDNLQNPVLRDLAFMRIVAPSSKLHAVSLLREYFSINYPINTVYQELSKIIPLKESVEKTAVLHARAHLSFDFSLVFYDVTTLYFESFTQDADLTDEKGEILIKGLRRNGFSKDNKSNQPQIVIGLIVTREGFPVSYDVFEGNTFEGKTFIPSITKFKNTHQVKTLTIVADAAMISFENVQELLKADLSYIVGARMASLKQTQIEEISTELIGKTEDILELTKREGASMRIQTDRGLLICDFSLKRYKKDKREMEKQITKAQKLLEKQDGIKRTKFLKNKNNKKTEQVINTDLIEKAKLLLGIKGYYTNLTEADNKTIISHYHSLWHVEKAFRIAKSDLEARPIFHHKRESIEAHILIVFVSMCLAKALELFSGVSIQKIRESIWQILDIELVDNLTNQKFIKRMEATENMSMGILEKIKTVTSPSKRVLKK